MKEKSEDKIKLSDFEKNLKRLEEIVAKLEKGELTLEESLKLFEEGIKLARTCEKALTEAERRVEILIRNEEGQMEAKPFVPSEELEQENSTDPKSTGTSLSKGANSNFYENHRKESNIDNEPERETEGDLPF